MLVDGGVRLNLISPDMIKRLLIPDEDLQKTGTFQGVNQGRSQPKGKITLPVMFYGELNYKTKKVVFDVVKLPLPYNGILGHPSLAKIHGSLALCLQHAQDARANGYHHHTLR
jgi:hypothetical protein